MKNIIRLLVSMFLFHQNIYAQKITDDYLIGKWSATDSNGQNTITKEYFDNDNMRWSFQGESHDFKYTFTKKGSAYSFHFNGLKNTSVFTVIPKGRDTMWVFNPGDYERFLLAGKAKAGTIAWGWSNPSPMIFKREQAD